MPRTVTVKMLADASQYISNIKRAGLATKDFAGEMDKAAKANKLDHVTNSAAVAGLGLVGLAGGAVKFSMDFEKSMSAVSAATHAPAKDLDQLRQAAIKAGQDTQFSATEAANGV
jgi:CheY-specific phosphatase CheX